MKKTQNYLSHAWLFDEKLAVGCENGDVILLDSTGEMLSLMATGAVITCMTKCGKGFCCGHRDGNLSFFNLTSETANTGKPGFLKKASLKLTNDTSSVACVAVSADNAGGSSSSSAATSKEASSAANREKNGASSAGSSTNMVVVSTVTGQLYKASVSVAELGARPDDQAPLALSADPLTCTFHTGAVNGMDVCVRKPIIATCGADKTVRVWNYLDKTLEVCKVFSEEPYSVALHPSGFHIVVGFSDKLRVFSLLMEDLRPYKDLPIKGCREVRYSHGGHYFAATNGNAIQLYKSYTCEPFLNLRGHNNKVRSLAWTADDSSLVSAGMDGGVYEFEVLNDGARAADWVNKGTNFSSVVVQTDPTTSADTIYVVGTDRSVREVFANALQNAGDCHAPVGHLCLAKSGRLLFAGLSPVNRGEEEDDDILRTPAPIRVVRFPIIKDLGVGLGHTGEINDAPAGAARPEDVAAHSAAITRLRMAQDDSYLFSCGEDGCIFLFELKKKEIGALPLGGCALAKEKKGASTQNANLLPATVTTLPFADEILVTRTFLDEKQAQLVELERQVDELQNQIEFQLRHRELYHKEKIAEFEDRSGQLIEQERAKYEVLREEKNDLEMECEENIRTIEERHAKQIADLEAGFQHKMIVEVSKYQKISTERDAKHKAWEAEYTELLEKQAKELEDAQRRFTEQKHLDGLQRQRILGEKDLSQRVHRETLYQLEQDADREIEELKEQYEERLANELDDKVRLRGQAGIHRKHHEDLKRGMLKKEEELKYFLDQAQKKQQTIDKMIMERERSVKEIKERDRMIGEKETKIYELKKQNAELEKFRFVLDYKIKELKSQIEPKNEDIAAMKTIIGSMDSDLEDYHRKNKLLQQDIANLQAKQAGLQEEILSQRKKLADSFGAVKRVKHDLHNVMDNVRSVKDFRKSLNGLYEKYLGKDRRSKGEEPTSRRDLPGKDRRGRGGAASSDSPPRRDFSCSGESEVAGGRTMGRSWLYYVMALEAGGR